VAITPGFRVSQHKRHVVKHIIAPGSAVPIEERPPIPSWEELWREREVRKQAKDERRALRMEVLRAEGRASKIDRIIKEARAEINARAKVIEAAVRREARKFGRVAGEEELERDRDGL
jgi:small subunit ribosomal protein S17